MKQNALIARLTGWPKSVAMFVVLAVAISYLKPPKDQRALYDFDTPGQLTEVFNSAGSGVANTSGCDRRHRQFGRNHGSSSDADAVFSTKEGWHGPVGSTYTFTSYIKSVYNSGYSGLGFTGSSPQQMQTERRSVRRTRLGSRSMVADLSFTTEPRTTAGTGRV